MTKLSTFIALQFENRSGLVPGERGPTLGPDCKCSRVTALLTRFQKVRYKTFQQNVTKISENGVNLLWAPQETANCFLLK